MPEPSGTAPLRLCLVLPSLECGGAQRVLTLLANHWAASGRELCILTLDAEPTFYPLHPAVRHRPLGLMADSASLLQGLGNNLRRLTALRRALQEERPHGVLAFLGDTNIKTLLATLGTGLPVVISERCHPALDVMSRPWRVLRRLAYPLARALAVQTSEIKDFFPRSLQRKTVLIPNPLTPLPEPVPPLAVAPPVLCALGRLHPQKGFDLLIRAFARVAPRFPHWSLRIHGEGPLRAELEALVRDSGLAGRVALPGVAPDAYAALADCAVFALPSRYEGFPNALMEAMAMGRAVVAADCPSGPAELIRPEHNGLLVSVEDVSALATALERLLDDAPLRERLGDAARDIAREFDVAAVAAQWDALLRRAGVPVPPVDADGGTP